MNYSYEDTEILINLKALDDQVEVSFRNEGDIIPEEKLQRIFEQFYRVDTARMGKTGGAGLGLAISKEIVELHGGSITAKSEKHMVEFMIKLPARQ